MAKAKANLKSKDEKYNMPKNPAMHKKKMIKREEMGKVEMPMKPKKRK